MSPAVGGKTPVKPLQITHNGALTALTCAGIPLLPLQAVFEAIGAGVVIVDVEGRVVRANSGAVRLPHAPATGIPPGLFADRSLLSATGRPVRLNDAAISPAFRGDTVNGLRRIVDASAESLVPFVQASVEAGSIVHTGGRLGYEPLKSKGLRWVK